MVNLICKSVYYVNAGLGQFSDPVAICPKIYDNKRIEWYSTGRMVNHLIKTIKIEGPELLDGTKEISPRKITLETTKGIKITLTEMDLQLYRKELKDYVVGQIDFNTTEELQRYYLETQFDS